MCTSAYISKRNNRKVNQNTKAPCAQESWRAGRGSPATHSADGTGGVASRVFSPSPWEGAATTQEAPAVGKRAPCLRPWLPPSLGSRMHSGPGRAGISWPVPQALDTRGLSTSVSLQAQSTRQLFSSMELQLSLS